MAQEAQVKLQSKLDAYCDALKSKQEEWETFDLIKKIMRTKQNISLLEPFLRLEELEAQIEVCDQLAAETKKHPLLALVAGDPVQRAQRLFAEYQSLQSSLLNE